jgi:DNA polymerase-3 subunit gamma/tau
MQYRVLARKYRPQTFADLVGQEVLVRTLSNAFASGRIAHAFLLTGIRGIGKTTTARIIARGLNCIGPDGNGGPTTSPCGECPNCKMILDDRHVDVIEMDAASRTGVDDIREIIDTVHYAPTNARMKIYIIDEVHMLSKNAFNALLKTLEEPPPHVKFIFATTELRKIPVTIISRCQRFDLRRLDTPMLAEHLVNIAQKESIALDAESATMIATAAEGSVRDALSLLDQTIAMSADAEGNVAISPERVRDMLGLADKSHVFALLAHVVAGDTQEAAEKLQQLYRNGADPALLLSDLLELVHYLTRIHAAPRLAANVQFSTAEQEEAKKLASALDMPGLARLWQMLLKGVDELKSAPNPLPALEMLLVRLAYVANLPSPAEIIRRIDQGGTLPPTPHGGGSGAVSRQTTAAPAMHSAPVMAMSGNLALAVRHEPEMAIAMQPETVAQLETFLDAVALVEKQREPLLLAHLTHDVELVSFTATEAGGRIELHPLRYLPPDFAARVGRLLSTETGLRWAVAFSDARGEQSLGAQAKSAREQALAYASAHPRVQEILSVFSDAEVVGFEKIG